MPAQLDRGLKTIMATEDARKIVEKAVVGAIKEVGVSEFKKTSLLLSNETTR